MVARTVALALEPDENPLRSPLRVAYRGNKLVLHLTFRDLEVAREDIVSLREAFEGCSPDELLAAVLRHEAGWRVRADALESRTYAMLMRKVVDALDAMIDTPPAMPRAEVDQVIGPFWRFIVEGSGSCLEHSMGAALYANDRSAAVAGLLSSGAERVCTWDDLRESQRRVSSDALDVAGMPAFEGSLRCLSSLAWSEALALPLWLPEGLSDQERYAVLAAVFWAMTYRGFTREEQARASGCDRAGKARQLPRIHVEPWPSDPVHAVLQHDCWIDALQMHEALFAMLRSSGNTPVTEEEAR